MRWLVPLSLMLVLAGCAAKKPGGQADVWTTSSYAEADIIYQGIGIRF